MSKGDSNFQRRQQGELQQPRPFYNATTGHVAVVVVAATEHAGARKLAREPSVSDMQERVSWYIRCY